MEDPMPPQSDLDEFTRSLNADDARILVDLLKLAVAQRAGEKARKTLSHILMALGKSYSQVRPSGYSKFRLHMSSLYKKVLKIY